MKYLLLLISLSAFAAPPGNTVPAVNPFSYTNTTFNQLIMSGFTSGDTQGSMTMLNGTWTKDPTTAFGTNAVYRLGNNGLFYAQQGFFTAGSQQWVVTNATHNDLVTPSVQALISSATTLVPLNSTAFPADGASGSVMPGFVRFPQTVITPFNSDTLLKTNNVDIAQFLRAYHLGSPQTWDIRFDSNIITLPTNTIGLIKSIYFVANPQIAGAVRDLTKMTNWELRVWSNYPNPSTNIPGTLWNDATKQPQFKVPLANLVTGFLATNLVWQNPGTGFLPYGINTCWIEAAIGSFIHAAIRFPIPFTNGVSICLWDKTNNAAVNSLYSIALYELLNTNLTPQNQRTFPFCNLVLHSTNFIDQQIIPGAGTNFMMVSNGPGTLLWLSGRYYGTTNVPQFLESSGNFAWQYTMETNTWYPIIGNLASGGEDIALNGFFFGTSLGYVQNRNFGTTFFRANSGSGGIRFAAEWYRAFGDGETFQWQNSFRLDHNYAADPGGVGQNMTNNLSIVYLAP